MMNPSKKEYHKATHQVHMEQERWKRELQKFKTPLPPPTTPLHTPHRGMCGRRAARKCVWVGECVGVWVGDILAMCVHVF